MSSTSYVEASAPPAPPPPPPDQIIKSSGQVRLSLREMFGPTIQGHLSRTLQDLTENRETFLHEQLGLSPDSQQADRLDWQQTAKGPGAIREYTMTMRPQDLPQKLREGKQIEFRVQLRIGGGVLQVRHDYFATVPASEVATASNRLRDVLESAVARAVNPVLATAVSQALKERAHVALEERLKQEQRLQTRVTETLNHQTRAFVRAAYSV